MGVEVLSVVRTWITQLPPQVACVLLSCGAWEISLNTYLGQPPKQYVLQFPFHISPILLQEPNKSKPTCPEQSLDHKLDVARSTFHYWMPSAQQHQLRWFTHCFWLVTFIFSILFWWVCQLLLAYLHALFVRILLVVLWRIWLNAGTWRERLKKVTLCTSQESSLQGEAIWKVMVAVPCVNGKKTTNVPNHEFLLLKSRCCLNPKEYGMCACVTVRLGPSLSEYNHWQFVFLCNRGTFLWLVVLDLSSQIG